MRQKNVRRELAIGLVESVMQDFFKNYVVYDITEGKSRSGNVKRGASMWFRDYLCDKPIYSRRLFRRIFGVPKVLFIKVYDELVQHKPSTWDTKRIVIGKKVYRRRLKYWHVFEYWRAEGPSTVLMKAA